MSRPLTEKQQAFVREYLVDLNGTAAAIRAGYSEKSACQQAHLMLNEKPRIMAAVQAAMDKRSKKTEITAERVLEEIAKCAFVNIQDLMDEDGAVLPPGKLDRNVAAALVEVTERVSGGDNPVTERRYKMADKLAALDKLGKHLKLFTDKVELEATHKMTISELMAKAAGDG